MELISSNLKCRLPASDKLLFDWVGNREIDNRELGEWMSLFVRKIPKLKPHNATGSRRPTFRTNQFSMDEAEVMLLSFLQKNRRTKQIKEDGQR